ncbi:MAG: SoxR reducing system RseC family protein [Candidatus Cryosericum sp.]|nr:SoxR reducing system RseC family protein [bacterium]
MPTDRGLVLSRTGNVVTVQVQPQEGCDSCALSQFCVGSKQDTPTVTAIAPSEIRQGDLVELSVSDSLLLKATAIIYGIPLVAFLVGVLGGYLYAAFTIQSMRTATVLPVIGGFLMLIPGVFISRKSGKRLNPTATVVRKLDQEATSKP